MEKMIAPRATYRLQFHENFTFLDATALVPYLARLGVSHIYASPFFFSAPGSVHGYDVCDHNSFDPEIGSEADFNALTAALRDRDMSILMDFVPNHMGIAGLENRWWTDVLENGSNSAFARYFDIDWKPVKRELENCVLLPILGDQYGQVLEKKELQVIWAEGAFRLDYLTRQLPLAPLTVLPILEAALGRADLPAETRRELLEEMDQVFRLKGSTDSAARDALREKLKTLGARGEPLEREIAAELEALNDDFDRLDALISAQNYRLANWKVAGQEINYRRFFDVNSLAALRMELPEVFNDTHQLLLNLVASRAVSGVRIDHIDGLAFPREYLCQLQTCMAGVLGVPEEKAAGYLLVEKILGPQEELPSEWPVHGTTGYEFTADLVGLLVDAGAEKVVTDGYHRFIQRSQEYRQTVYEGKRLVMAATLASEVNTLGHLLNRISEGQRWYRDYTLNALTEVVREVIACFPVYRSYLEPNTPPLDRDRRVILKAIATARRRNPAMERSAFHFLNDILLPPEPNIHPVDEKLRQLFVTKFQQSTSPITAKGTEDTAFYIYNRFVALNEVGGEPGIFGLSVEQFHTHNARRAATYPHNMLTTSTHDTKRSEDVRARLAVLSEKPLEWTRAMRRWQNLNKRKHNEVEGELAPDANEEYLLYQTLLGSWPLQPMDEAEHAEYVERIRAYMKKALYEAKVNSSWINPHEKRDEAVLDFVQRILTPGWKNPFLGYFQTFLESIVLPGAINSLTQTVLKLTSPGMPDVYQGTELWDWSLVDPDNRRPVDFAQRQQLLGAVSGEVDPRDLRENWRDGRIKLFVIHRLLQFRLQQPELFASGSYRALPASGPKAHCAVAFLRQTEAMNLLVLVPRLTTQLGGEGMIGAWGETRMEEVASGPWVNIFTGQEIREISRIGALLEEFPVGVWSSLPTERAPH